MKRCMLFGRFPAGVGVIAKNTVAIDRQVLLTCDDRYVAKQNKYRG